MPFSKQLENALRKGSFPLKSTGGLQLWKELVSKLEYSFHPTVVEVKALIENSNWIDIDDSYFGNILEVNAVTLTLSPDDERFLIGAMHEALTSDFGVATNKKSIVPSLIQRVRALAVKHGLVEESDVALGAVAPGHMMGTGLTTTGTLTFIPDPSLGTHDYGSTPDQKAVGHAAPPWNTLKQRVYVNRNTGKLGRKPHYVLAHLINHNINGSGLDPRNVFPLYADANTEMNRVVEEHLKMLVQQGIPVHYTITQGPPVGMGNGRQALHDNAAAGSEQQKIIALEATLPAYITVTLEAQDMTGWHQIVPPTPINNFVPVTIPVI